MFFNFLFLTFVGVWATQVNAQNEQTEYLENPDGSRESWGYVEVRPGANMFWWLYYTTAPADYYERPLIMWLDAGRRTSSVGFDNFLQIGPLHLNLTKREEAWNQHANLLFVDSPVGTGFSYVKSPCLLNTNNSEIVYDLLELFSNFMKTNPQFQTSPFYIFAESYGGNIATEFALALHKRYEDGEIICNFKGVSLGGSRISPDDSALSWAPYLYSLGFIDKAGLGRINHYANVAKNVLDLGLGTIATAISNSTLGLIRTETNGVDLVNVLNPVLPPEIVDLGEYRPQVSVRELFGNISSDRKSQFSSAPQLKAALTEIAEILNQRFITFSNPEWFLITDTQRLQNLMNGKTIRNKLKIIPQSVRFGAQSSHAWQALEEHFMKPVVNVVEELLTYTPIQITVFQGQLDLLYGTLGTLRWVNKLKWEGIQEWRKAPRNPILINGTTEMYEKSYGNFSFYWILKSGHFVAADAPTTALEMMQCITKLKTCGEYY